MCCLPRISLRLPTILLAVLAVACLATGYKGEESSSTTTGSGADAGSADVIPGTTSPPGPSDGGGREYSCTGHSQCAAAGMICDSDSNTCVEPPCPPGGGYCAGDKWLAECPADGSKPRVSNCGPGRTCVEGACREDVCEPGLRCREGVAYECNESGTHEERTLCPGGRSCIEGECRPILHNVLLLFDTSFSMNQCADGSGDDYLDCCDNGCPQEWPICETADNPLSKLGMSKALFAEFLATPIASAATRFAMLTFPQEENEYDNGCDGGHYGMRSKMSDDAGEHVTPGPPSGWFHTNVKEVVRVPFATDWEGDSTWEIRRWLDFVEIAGANPELRGAGGTPLGRTMFYAGEYLRHYVVVDGKPCTVDADCKSQDYVCVEGRCKDPARHCRHNVFLVFTDGRESNHRLVDNFYNPAVQARRMKFGLGCRAETDCIGGAICESGFCRRAPVSSGPCTSDVDCEGEAYCVEGSCTTPGFEWPTNLGACRNSRLPCETDGERCDGMFESCELLEPRYDDGASGSNVLRAFDGSPIEVTTHVIDVSEEATESSLTAAHGGGLHFATSINAREVLRAILQRTIDFKYGLSCELE